MEASASVEDSQPSSSSSSNQTTSSVPSTSDSDPPPGLTAPQKRFFYGAELRGERLDKTAKRLDRSERELKDWIRETQRAGKLSPHWEARLTPSFPTLPRPVEPDFALQEDEFLIDWYNNGCRDIIMDVFHPSRGRESLRSRLAELISISNLIHDDTRRNIHSLIFKHRMPSTAIQPEPWHNQIPWRCTVQNPHHILHLGQSCNGDHGQPNWYRVCEVAQHVQTVYRTSHPGQDNLDITLTPSICMAVLSLEVGEQMRELHPRFRHWGHGAERDTPVFMT
ncbi:MAG: hypothetical protein M1825_003817 [Sarcosagium campestre]|nr:MAG: hypothetical protein M1825_003817 [Sarcosagium campestre]